MNLLTKNDPQTQNQTPERRTIRPQYNVQETTEAFVITAFVPGVEPSAVETTLDGETLTINARRTWKAPEQWIPVYRETVQADYRLVLELDPRVNRDGVAAALRQGVLTVTVPKAEAVKPRKIEITG